MKAEPDSPTRCQHTSSTKQCDEESVHGEKFCKTHLPKKTAFQLGSAFARVETIARNPEARSLATEVAILQAQMEIIAQACTSAHDVIANEHKLSGLIERIAKVTLIAHKLAVANGNVLDKNTLLTLMDEVAGVIANHVKDKETQKLIAEGIGDAILRATQSAAQQASDKITTE